MLLYYSIICGVYPSLLKEGYSHLSHLQDEKPSKNIKYMSDWIGLAAAWRTDWKGDKSRSRETIKELIGQSRGAGGLDQVAVMEVGKKGSDSEYILKEGTIGLPQWLDVEYERKRIIKDFGLDKWINTLWY